MEYKKRHLTETTLHVLVYLGVISNPKRKIHSCLKGLEPFFTLLGAILVIVYWREKQNEWLRLFYLK